MRAVFEQFNAVVHVTQQGVIPDVEQYVVRLYVSVNDTTSTRHHVSEFSNNILAHEIQFDEEFVNNNPSYNEPANIKTYH